MSRRESKRPEWNFNVGRVMIPNSRFAQVPKEPKRFQRMSEDIRNFTAKAYSMPSIAGSSIMSSNSPDGGFSSLFGVKPIEGFSIRPDGSKMSLFAAISSTFGFEHHTGTDRSAEMKVLKLLLKRENLLLLIEAHADKLLEIENMKGIKSIQIPRHGDFLDILTRLRNITLDLVEAVCSWRLTAIDDNSNGPKPFIWKRNSYLLKVIQDLDFMGGIKPLYESLNIPPEKLIANPLMMPNTLNEMGRWSTPEESARFDVQGKVDTDFYKERLRMRKAEVILLQEIEYNTERVNSRENLNKIYFQPNKPMMDADNISPNDSEEPQQAVDFDQTERRFNYSIRQPMAVDKAQGDDIRDPNDFECLYDDDFDDYAYLQLEKGADKITFSDLETLMKITSPHKNLQLTSAALMILLSDNETAIPKDISWNAFIAKAAAEDMAWDMNGIVQSETPRFKIRAIKPFLIHLKEYLDVLVNANTSLTDPTHSIIKLIKWIIKIVESPQIDPDSPGNLSKVSKTDKLLASISSNVNKNDRKKKVESAGTTNEKSIVTKPVITPAERRRNGEKHTRSSTAPKVFTPKPLKIERKLCTLYSEMLYDVYESPVILTLLGPAYLLTGGESVIPEKFIAKIYDPLTSTDSEVSISTREYTLLLRDLQNQFGFDLTAYFVPISFRWWIQNLKSIIVVKTKSNKKLLLYINKKKIEDIIAKKLSFEDEPMYIEEDGGYLNDEFDEVLGFDLADDIPLPPQAIEIQERPVSQPGQDRIRLASTNQIHRGNITNTSTINTNTTSSSTLATQPRVGTAPSKKSSRMSSNSKTPDNYEKRVSSAPRTNKNKKATPAALTVTLSLKDDDAVYLESYNAAGVSSSSLFSSSTRRSLEAEDFEGLQNVPAAGYPIYDDNGYDKDLNTQDNTSLGIFDDLSESDGEKKLDSERFSRDDIDSL